MAYTYKPLPNGKVDIIDASGKSLLQGTNGPGFDLSYAKQLGAQPVAAPPAVPPTQGGATATLPQQQTGGSLTSFATKLQQITALAKQNRNAASLDLMAPYRGTVAASDFNSILSNLNAASNSYATDLTEKALDYEAQANKRQFKTDQIGNTLYQYEVDADGQIVGKPTPVLSAPKNTGKAPKPIEKAGKFEYSEDAYQEDKQDLDATRGKDGWVDPAVYQRLYKEWLAKGLSTDAFLKRFPPKMYVNPANNKLPTILRNPTKPKDDANGIDYDNDLQ